MTTTIGSLDLNAFSDLYSDSTQYFWFESDSTATYGAGAHVTLVPDTSFISNPTGQNILMNTDGFSIRNGLLPMMTLDNDSLDFNFVDTTAGTYTTMATFGLSGMQIYSRDSGNNLVQLANIGYGEGAGTSGTTVAPYYTLGTRASGSTIGNNSMAEGVGVTASGFASHAEGYHTISSGHYSHAEGNETTASNYYSHAEGSDTTASGYYCHAEGHNTTASGSASHAEGDNTTASGEYSHAEGFLTIVSGNYAHAQNYGTIAQRKSQTVLGEFNIADIGGTNEKARGDYVFIIGNGTTTARSNAFTVDWNGNVEAAGDYYSKVNQISLGTYITGGVLTSNSSNIHFSIPTGRVFPDGTTISKLTFNIVVRASNSNASGLYIVKNASGGTDVKYYDSTASFQFYNGANQPKTLTTAMSTISLQGGTNIYVNWVGSGNYFFSGTSTYNGYVNNQPISVMLTDITATLNIPS